MSSLTRSCWHRSRSISSKAGSSAARCLTMPIMIALLSLSIWVYLFLAHGRFWSSEPELAPAAPAECPDVDVVVPARDEAQTIGPVIASLLGQDYAGKFRIFLVD